MIELESGEAREAYNSPYEEEKLSTLALRSIQTEPSEIRAIGYFHTMPCQEFPRARRFRRQPGNGNFDFVFAMCRSYEAVYASSVSPEGFVPSRAALYRVS
jgi:hypothetical protein